MPERRGGVRGTGPLPDHVWEDCPGTRHIRCCDCGTELLSCDRDALTKLALCADCWRRLPQAVIVERSRKHQAKGHEGDKGGVYGSER